MVNATALDTDRRNHFTRIFSCCKRSDCHLHIGKRKRDIGDKVRCVFGDNAQHRLEAARGIAVKLFRPGSDYPTVLVVRVGKSALRVGTIVFMNRNAVSACDITDNTVTRKGITAFCKLNGATLDAVDDNAVGIAACAPFIAGGI